MTGTCGFEQCADCPGQLVCRCLHVTEEMVLAAIAGGACTIVDLKAATTAGDGCMSCHRKLMGYLVKSGCCQVEQLPGRRSLMTV